MKKYLVRFEFRYTSKALHNSNSKFVTVGVYDSQEEAIKKGNDAYKLSQKEYEDD